MNIQRIRAIFSRHSFWSIYHTHRFIVTQKDKICLLIYVLFVNWVGSTNVYFGEKENEIFAVNEQVLVYWTLQYGERNNID